MIPCKWMTLLDADHIDWCLVTRS